MAKYNTEFKLEVIKYYNKNGTSKTLKMYNISETALYKWLRNYEGGTFMRKQTSNYTIEDKIEIIEYYRNNGVKTTEDNYNISRSVFYRWEKILIEEGKEALGLERRGRPGTPRVKNDASQNKDLLKEVQRLRLENAYLKKLRALTQEKTKKK